MSIEPTLRVKAATLWLYVQLSSHHRVVRPDTNLPVKRTPTLYIFRVLSHPHRHHHNTVCTSGIHWHSSDEDLLTDFNARFRRPKQSWTNELLVSQRVTLQHSGWVKLNLTEGVQKWFSSSPPGGGDAGKLRLLVDCSGCGSNVHPVLFGNNHPAGSSYKRRRRKRHQDEQESEQADETDTERHRPFLVVHTDSTNARLDFNSGGFAL